MRALLEGACRTRRAAQALIYRARAEADFVFRAELDALAARRGIQLFYLAEPASGARCGGRPTATAATKTPAPARARPGPARRVRLRPRRVDGGGRGRRPAPRRTEEQLRPNGSRGRRMRRIVMWFLGTVAAVALLFSYRTSTSGRWAGRLSRGGRAKRISTGGPGSTGDTGGVVGSRLARRRGRQRRGGPDRWGPVRYRVRSRPTTSSTSGSCTGPTETAPTGR
jgi:hypothetical protein